MGVLRAAAALAVLGAAGPAGASNSEWVYELGPYDTSLALYVPLDGAPLPEVSGDDELATYRQLLLQSLQPSTLEFEARVYPVPVLGTWIRRNEPDRYEDAEISNGLNWVESVTSGFREPGALSVSFGSAVNLVREGEERRDANKAIVGYRLSGGGRHIRHNVLVPDDWYEVEWRFRGERVFADDELDWDFRAGMHQHSNHDIADQVYVGIQRSSFDLRAPFLSWLTNTALDLEVGLTENDRSLAGIELLFQKNYPVPAWRVAIALEAGFIFHDARAYSGTLRDEDEVLFVIRPNLEF